MNVLADCVSEQF